MNTIYCLSKSEYYAPFPLFKVYPDLAIGDINLASQVLFDSLLDEDFRESIRQSLNELQLKSAGTLVATGQAALNGEGFEDAITDTVQGRVFSMEYGMITFKLTVIAIHNPDFNDSLDRIAYIGFDNIRLVEDFLTIYQKRLKHQLIWETYAVGYDVILQKMDYYAEVVNRHHSALCAEGINRVIDIGAGTGNVTIPLLQSGRSVTAIDMSRAMLDKMNSKLRDLDQPRIEIFQQSAEDLSDFADSSFDGVNILLALFDMGKPVAALDEAIRILRPSGTLIITEPKRTFNLLSLLSHAEKCLKDKGVYDKLSSHWACVSRANIIIDPSVRSTPLYIEDIQEKLGKAGFNITDVKDSHYGNCATLRANKPV